MGRKLRCHQQMGTKPRWHPEEPGEFHGLRSLVGYCPWGRKESDTTKQLTLSFSQIRNLEGFLQGSQGRAGLRWKPTNWQRIFNEHEGLGGAGVGIGLRTRWVGQWWRGICLELSHYLHPGAGGGEAGCQGRVGDPWDRWQGSNGVGGAWLWTGVILPSSGSPA